MPKQQDLVPDAEIRELEEVGVAYADIRDRRIALNQEEKKLKQEAMVLMKKHRKKVYHRNGIEILLEPGEESIKVRVKPLKDDEDEDDDDEA